MQFAREENVMRNVGVNSTSLAYEARLARRLLEHIKRDLSSESIHGLADLEKMLGDASDRVAAARKQLQTTGGILKEFLEKGATD